jgi:hypothetical protein
MDDTIRAGEPLVLTPAQAQAALQCGPTRLWELINAGEIESFLDGARRRITARSIRNYVSRKLAASPAKKVVPARRGRRPAAGSAAA